MTARRVLVAACYIMLLPALASAQTGQSGSIAGTVRDGSGAVLPGVTVEASSPALIEGVRTAVTDGQGLYRIIELRPGPYTVTFTLPGFTTLRREGIELVTGFTATVNGELSVGAVEETVTVTGEAPMVDISNVRTQEVYSRDTLDALPLSRTSRGYVGLLLGATMSARFQDVGGNTGEEPGNIAVHGNRGGDMIFNVEGMPVSRAMGAGGGFRVYSINQGGVQEITFQTSGMSAESETGGIQMNIVPREGANVFSTYFATNYANSNMQGENVTDELRARGFQAGVLKVDRIYDANGAFGGPVKRDRLWFYTTHRWWGTTRPLPAPGNFFNKNAGTDRYYIYEPDLSRPQKSELPRRSHNVRLTWQAAERHKLNFFFDTQPACNCPRIYEGEFAPEAMADHIYTPNRLHQVSWSSPTTNRLLFDGGVTYYNMGIDYSELKGADPNAIAVIDRSTNISLNARARGNNAIRAGDSYGRVEDHQVNGRFAASYVTGSHNFKAGATWLWNKAEERSRMAGDVVYRFLNGAPVDIVQWATPNVNFSRSFNAGLYAQDQWTIRKLTMNLGLRFDHLRGWAPESTAPAGTWLPARSFDRVDDLPNFQDLSPRVGAAYDLFGNGRTALRASLGRYVELIGTDTARNFAPSWAIVRSATRTWNDVNGDIIPQESELGRSSDSAFGTPRVTTTLADDARKGFGKRFYNWQASAVLQHEVRPGLSTTVGYYRTWYGNFTVTDNVLVGPADFNEYCVTAPVDSRLPGGGGNQICGLYDIAPARFGQVESVIRSMDTFGGRSEVYNGVDFSMNGRFPNGAQLGGGISTGQTAYDNCNLAKVDSPGAARFCEYKLAFADQTQFKLHAVYPLPWDIQTSANFQDLPGIPITSNHVLRNAEIAPSLGRNLAAGARGTAVIELIEPGTMREDRRRQVDFRVARSFQFGATARVLGTFEVFNVLNASSVLQLTTRYGSAWLRPGEILGARIVKVGMQLSF